MTRPFNLVPGQLDLPTLKTLFITRKNVELDSSCFDAIAASQAMVEKVVKDKKIVYGINTGFGSLANQCISDTKLEQLQRNLVLSHACGTGENLEDDVVSLILLLKINALAQGYSGVRLALIQALVALYNKKVYPCIPAKGSVGASGDLVPLAHLALILLGEGEVSYQGKIYSAKEGLGFAGLQPFSFIAKEGLALLNGLQVSAALCMRALFKAEWLFEAAILAGSLSVEAACGSDIPFDDRIQRVRGYEAQIDVAAMFRVLLKNSPMRDSHQAYQRVQDPYSLRCQPQIMGAVLHQIRFVASTLQVEANAVSDNPLIFAEDQDILSGGNFHGEILAMAADNLALAVAEIGANAERRIALLIDHHFSGLPPFLVKESGLHSGFMIAHVTAAACASDNKALAHPHCVDSLPTSANQEDHVSMATNGALRLEAMIYNTATILAIEYLAACQGLDLRKPLKTSAILQKAYDKVREKVASYEEDRYFAPDIAVIKQKILQGDFAMEHFYGS